MAKPAIHSVSPSLDASIFKAPHNGYGVRVGFRRGPIIISAAAGIYRASEHAFAIVASTAPGAMNANAPNDTIPKDPIIWHGRLPFEAYR
jgi:hypothetical protein